MALGRIKTWNPGDVLTAADLNAEFNNPLNNPISLVSPTTGAINFQTSVAHTNLTPSAITGTSGSAGQALVITSSGPAAWGGPFVGSNVKGLTGNVTTGQTMVLAYDQCTLQSTAGTYSHVVTATGTFTLNVGTSGPAANGRDQAAVFASTFIRAFAISTGLGSTTPAGILSSSLIPTLPTSYVTYAYLGAHPYSTSSTQFNNAQRVKGSWIFNEAAQAVVSSGTATVETAAGLGATVPIEALSYVAMVEARFSDTIANQAAQVLLRTTSGLNYGPPVTVRTFTTVTGYQDVSVVMPNTSQNLYYLWADLVVNVPTRNVDISIQGYNVPNGGE